MSALRTSLLVTGLLTASALACSVTACGNGDDDDAASTADAGHDASAADAASTDAAKTSSDASSTGYDDAQIVQILVTFDNGEEAEAETASGQASSEAVHTLASGIDNYYYQQSNVLVEYADRVHLTLTDSTESTSLTATFTADATSYKSASGAAFDSAYVAAQISEHTAILALIDSKLAPAITDPTLANLVTAQRAQYATSLASFQTVLADGGT